MSDTKGYRRVLDAFLLPQHCLVPFYYFRKKKVFNELSLSWKHDLLNISIHHRRPVWWTFLNGKMGGKETKGD